MMLNIWLMSISICLVIFMIGQELFGKKIFIKVRECCQVVRQNMQITMILEDCWKKS